MITSIIVTSLANPATLRRMAALTPSVSFNRWLSRYAGASARAADKELQRLTLWCAHHDLAVMDLTTEDAQAFLRFLGNPQPIDKWVGPPRPRLLPSGLPNPAWRPLAGPLSAASVRVAKGYLSALFEYLKDEGLTSRNPFANTRIQGLVRRRDEGVERALSPEAVAHLRQWLAQLPGLTGAQYARKTYLQLALEMFLLTGLRRAEVLTAGCDNLYSDSQGWWLRVVGKGNVQSDIPVPDTLVQAHVRMRSARATRATKAADDSGSAPAPAAAFEGPLLPGPAGRPLSSSGLYALVRRMMTQAAQTASPAVAQELALATPHWLRHTYAQTLVDAGVPLDVVRDNMRHASLQTTSQYVRARRGRRQAKTMEALESSARDPGSP